MSTGPDTDDDILPGGRGEDAALAAEYVMGLLPEAERRAVEARVVIEPAMRAEVEFWHDRFAQMAETEIVPVAPPPQLKTWTEEQIFGASAKKRAPRKRRRPVLSFVFGALFGAGGLAAAMAVFVAVQSGLKLPVDIPPGLMPAPGPAFVARIEGDEAEIVALVRTAAGGRAGLLELTLVRQDAPEGRVLELWIIQGEAAPVSLGVLPDGTRSAVPLGPALADLLTGAILAISDEPPGGSPTGAPTGTVRATAPLTEL